MQVLLGADPEVFVYRNGKPFSAWGMIPGTKASPFKVPFGATQVDGNALEFNIDPARTEEEFVHNISSVFTTLQGMIPKDCQIEVRPSVHFSWDHLKGLPPEALELGCDPDFNAYTMDINKKPDGSTNMRTAAGHIHIGFTDGMDPFDPAHFQSCATLVQQLDYFLGVPSLVLDQDTDRRKLYGKAGCFRPKSYGVEYRVLSNFWLKTPKLISWAYQTTHLAIEQLMKGNNLSKKYGPIAQLAIDEGHNPLGCVNRIREEHPKLWEEINTINYEG